MKNFKEKKTNNKTLECKNDLKEYQNLIAGCFKRPLGTSLAIFNLRCDIVYCMYRGVGVRLFTFSKRWDGTSNTEAICTCTQTVQQRGWKVKNLPGIKGVNFCNSVSIHMTSRGLKLKKNKSNDWFISFFHLLCFQNHSNKNSHITCIYMYWNALIWVLKVKKIKLK